MVEAALPFFGFSLNSTLVEIAASPASRLTTVLRGSSPSGNG
jgi:hypothetical protein